MDQHHALRKTTKGMKGSSFRNRLSSSSGALIAFGILLVFVFVIASALKPDVAFAGDSPVSAAGFGFNASRNGYCPILADMVKELGLTEEQAARIRAIDEDFWNRSQSLRDQMREKRLELRQLYSTVDPDKGAIEAFHAEVLGIKEKLRALSSEKRQAVENVLNEEQKEKIDALRSGFCAGHRAKGPRMKGSQGSRFRGR